ncbi:hypothetical protein ACLESO_31530, partial [Pyxidicoccus sp. 3LG]
LFARAPAPTAADVAPAELSFSLSGMDITPRQGTVYKPGAKKLQGVAIILKRLIGGQYRPGLEDRLLAYIEEGLKKDRGGSLEVSGQLVGSATEAEQASNIHVAPRVAQLILRWIDEQGFQADVNSAQRKLLAMGVTAGDAWADLNDLQLDPSLRASLPSWYSRYLFERELARRIDLLQAYRTAADRFTSDASADNRAAKVRSLRNIVDALGPPAAALEAIRKDAQLVQHPGYVLLWAREALRAPGKGAKPVALPTKPVPEGTGPQPQIAANFLAFAFTQPILSLGAQVDAGARKDLLDRFVRFAGRMLSSGGDEHLFGTPPKANAPPLASYLTSYPGLQPPLYQAALGTDYAFEMHVEHPDVFSAMASYGYFWERLRIPDSQVAGMMDASQMSGERPSMKEVAKERFARVTRYNEADMKLVMGKVSSYLGPPGIGAPSLVAANAIMRYIGTGISLGFEIISTPAYTRHIVFPEGGYYLVRCRAALMSSGNLVEGEIIRPPSVAYMPVVAQPGQRIAETQATEAAKERTKSASRLAELEAMLQQPVTYANQKELEEELAALKADLGSLATSLRHRKKMLEQRRDALVLGTLERRDVERQLSYVDDLLDTYGKRLAKRPDLAGAERLVATFVNDEGQLIHLALELSVKPLEAGGFEAYISDLTTSRSGHSLRTGATRAEAIKASLKHLLTEQSEYGRGHVSVVIDGKTETERIEAGTNRLMMEALENVATALSIAAVAAAPFTGGASLAILLPVGAVGAIPSAYRLASRAEASTLRFDLDTAMDIVNVVGGFAGLGEAVTPLRMVRLGKAFMWMGVGSGKMGMVLMGAQLVEQLDALEGLPAGLRAARAMQIIGNAMLSVGLMAGTELAMRGRAREMAEAAHFGPPLEMPTGAVGAVRGKTYEGLKPGKLSAERLETSVTKAAAKEMLHKAKVQKATPPKDATPQALHYELEVPQAGGQPAIKVQVELRSTAELPAGPHVGPEGTDVSGPGRVIISNEGGKWKATVLVERNLHEVQEAPHVLAHEFNEIADLVHRHPNASELVIGQQQQASLFKPGSTATDVTAHDRAAARELVSLHEEMPKLQSTAETTRGGLERAKAQLEASREALKTASGTDKTTLEKKIPQLEKQIATTTPTVTQAEQEFASKKARLDRMLDSMGLGESVNLDKKLATLRENGVPEQLVEYAHDRMTAPLHEQAGLAAHAAYTAGGRPHAGTVDVDAPTMTHLLYPADVNTTAGDWKDRGLSGGHDNKVLQDWLRNRPRIHLVETGQKTLPNGSKVYRYDQYRWKGPGEPPPMTDTAKRPGGASFEPGKWVRSDQPKTTADDSPAMFALAEDAFMAWYQKNQALAQTSTKFGPETVQGVAFGGFYEVIPPQPPSTTPRFRLRTVYVEASWF